MAVIYLTWLFGFIIYHPERPKATPAKHGPVSASARTWHSDAAGVSKGKVGTAAPFVIFGLCNIMELSFPVAGTKASVYNTNILLFNRRRLGA